MTSALQHYLTHPRPERSGEPLDYLLLATASFFATYTFLTLIGLQRKVAEFTATHLTDWRRLQAFLALTPLKDVGGLTATVSAAALTAFFLESFSKYHRGQVQARAESAADELLAKQNPSSTEEELVTTRLAAFPFLSSAIARKVRLQGVDPLVCLLHGRSLEPTLRILELYGSLERSRAQGLVKQYLEQHPERIAEMTALRLESFRSLYTDDVFSAMRRGALILSLWEEPRLNKLWPLERYTKAELAAIPEPFASAIKAKISVVTVEYLGYEAIAEKLRPQLEAFGTSPEEIHYRLIGIALTGQGLSFAQVVGNGEVRGLLGLSLLSVAYNAKKVPLAYRKAWLVEYAKALRAWMERLKKERLNGEDTRYLQPKQAIALILDELEPKEALAALGGIILHDLLDGVREFEKRHQYIREAVRICAEQKALDANGREFSHAVGELASLMMTTDKQIEPVFWSRSEWMRRYRNQFSWETEFFTRILDILEQPGRVLSWLGAEVLISRFADDKDRLYRYIHALTRACLKTKQEGLSDPNRAETFNRCTRQLAVLIGSTDDRAKMLFIPAAEWLASHPRDRYLPPTKLEEFCWFGGKIIAERYKGQVLTLQAFVVEAQKWCQEVVPTYRLKDGRYEALDLAQESRFYSRTNQLAALLGLSTPVVRMQFFKEREWNTYFPQAGAWKQQALL